MHAKITKQLAEQLKPDPREKPRPREIFDTDLKGLILRMQPTGQRTWFYAYTIGGKRRRYRLGSYPGLSTDGARGVVPGLAGDVSRGIDPQARREAERIEAERSRVATLRVFLDDRYEPWAQTHLKSATFQLARIRSDFAEWLDKPMTTITTEILEDTRAKWRKGGLAARTTNRDMQRLQAVLSRAVATKVLDRNPFDELKPLKVDRKGRVRFLSADEESALRKALTDREERLRTARDRFNAWRKARHLKLLPPREGVYGDRLQPMVLLALNTGLRRGELLALRWADVDLTAKLLTVTGTNAKSGNTRHIPLNAEAVTVLETWRTLRKDDGLLFGRRDGRRMKRTSRGWARVKEDAGITNFRFHDLRHHFASRMVQSGVDLNTVRELLGHADIETVMIYAHLAPDNLARAVEKVAR